MDLPYDLQAMIELYVADAMRATGTARGSVAPPTIEHEPEPLIDPCTHHLDDVLDELATDGLDYAALFDEHPPAPLPRTRAARGTRPPTGAEPVWVSFEDDVTEVVKRPPTSER